MKVVVLNTKSNVLLGGMSDHRFDEKNCKAAGITMAEGEHGILAVCKGETTCIPYGVIESYALAPVPAELTGTEKLAAEKAKTPAPHPDGKSFLGDRKKQ